MNIPAPLRLVMARNHDFTMDMPAFREKVAHASPPLDPDLVSKVYGDYGEAKQLFDNARFAGMLFLDEASHQFTLENGATLLVYASLGIAQIHLQIGFQIIYLISAWLVLNGLPDLLDVLT